jgi:hypothetical protein
MTTLEKIQRFERYLELTRGASDKTLDVVLDKLIDRKRMALSQERDEMRAELTAFEEQYRMPSPEFFEKFERGELGDATDFFEWSATWQMYNNTLQYLQALSAESPAVS